MTEFSEFLTMKLIELKRFEKKGMSDNLVEHLMTSTEWSKNLNVRVPIHLVAEIEVLAQHLNVSKAGLVMEILESAMLETRKQIEAQGWLDSYLESHLNHLEKNFGAIIQRDEEGKLVSLSYPNEK